jgi:Ca2+-transporting ATPase
VFSIGPFSNRWLVWATVASLVLLLAAIYVPFLQVVFGTLPLGLNDWLMMLPFMFIAPVTAELTKLYLKRRAERLALARA